VAVLKPPGGPPESSLSWEAARERIAADRRAECLAAFEMTFPSGVVPVDKPYADYAVRSFPKGRPLLEGVMALTERIHREFEFDPAATTVSTPVAQVMKQRRGVCQDFAHFQIACLRSLGLPTRYVSGYIRTNPPPGQPRLVGVDATHAWVGVFCPDLGWVEYDPTNSQRAGINHIRVAVGRDYRDIIPLRGTVIGGGGQQLSIGVTVTPLDEEAPIRSRQTGGDGAR
ncbi:MAG: transglutaminase family protein, partial [Verrucomicrobiae bacterium]|nr:transglutaminase family protein [Verrucomicrobiae bacterium]